MRNEDTRGKRILFVSSCILNVNNKVRELARYKGALQGLLDLAEEYGIGLQQMDCPETLYLGVNRWSAVKNLYDTPGFRRLCREIAGRIADYLYSYMQAGYDVLGILWINGSPTCGYEKTCMDEKWGGTPTDFEDESTFVPGKGVLVEELDRVLAERNIPAPHHIGMDLEDMDVTLQECCDNLRKYLRNKDNLLSAETLGD